MSAMPTEAELQTIDCKCDYCGCSLDRYSKIWVWNEHFACSRAHVQLAQGITNTLAQAEKKVVGFDVYHGTGKDTDLL